MKPKILVLGAGGQLGTELTQALWKEFGMSQVVTSDIHETKGILREGVFELVDATQRESIHDVIRKHNITQVYHLAALLSGTAEKNPAAGWDINMKSLLLVLEAARDFKLEKIFWPSSIAVFGPDTPKQNTPQLTPMNPTSVYGISKLAGELWCAYFHQRYGVDVRSLRYPGIIGWKTKPGGGTTDYAVDIYFQAILQKQYTCFLSANTYLPMMYMNDAVRATLQLMESPSAQLKTRAAYNIHAMSFCPADVALSIQQHLPDFYITYQPDFRQAIADSWPQAIDDTEARQDWGWKPQYDLPSMTADMLKNIPSVLPHSSIGR